MADSVECVVVGAGVVGLAVARALALGGREVIVLEAEPGIGMHTSSRNSEVIHAGLYYRKGGLRAQLFPRARDLLYAYCAEHGVSHRRIGKLVVARNAEEVSRLREHMAYAAASGVNDLQWLEAAQAQALEPNLSCHAAYLSPSSGIVDSHALMLAYRADIETAGGMVVTRAPVEGGAVTADGFSLDVAGAEPMNLTCRLLINCAAHGAPRLARRITGIPERTIPNLYFRRGVYFTVTGTPPFQRLIYPVHGHTGLDIHAVVDLAGQVRFGPDNEFIDGLDYSVDPARAKHFYPAIRSFWPGLADGALQPGYAGIRPAITGPGEPPLDYQVLGPREHGVPGLINLFGIESPGLTASLALGEYVAAKLAAEAAD
jgi:L-2-hydroxyglutarate oxidase LhgO